MSIYKWEWEDETGKWNAFDDFNSASLEQVAVSVTFPTYLTYVGGCSVLVCLQSCRRRDAKDV